MSSIYTISKQVLKQAPSYRWRKFCLDYVCWTLPQKKLPHFTPSWQEVKFERSNKSRVPEEQGIYIFVVRHPGGHLVNHDHRFILYVGQTVNLRQRFNQYFRYENTDEPSDQLKREMVIVWEDLLYFGFFTTTNFSKEERTDIEYDLIDYIVPPINEEWRADYVKNTAKSMSKI
jgi:hypothetical protein